MASDSPADLAVVLGAGPVGRSLVQRCVEAGRPVRVATRTGMAVVPDGVPVVAADVADPASARRACEGASVVYSCVGLDYGNWAERWPPMMEGMLAGAEAASARFVFMDNCYMYGPVDQPMHEDLPLTDYGTKPATRSALTRLWQQANAEGRVQAVSVRASDFYGPGVQLAALGELSFGRIAKGKSAQLVGDPDMPHSFTYVPDVARALVTIGEADDDCTGQAWNVPNAHTQTARRLLEMFTEAGGWSLKVQAMPRFLIAALGLVNSDLREMKEMLYQWERPFIVDSTKFEQRFWSDATRFEDGIAATAQSYAAAAPLR